MPEQRYLVTARKYRPLTFADLVAQQHVSETLLNALRLDRLAHAYLFSGPRGVGKTTAARILAKAINCTTPLDARPKGGEPCRACESCQSFEEGRSLNIIEIDAASNNRVDDIRELRETVRVPPQGSRKKVYIVDEVHMLSQAAFNALLKTLEEPPPYVLFIFATTEPNKVLPTILSRCQRFDFRRIAVPEILSRLREICELEGITADEDALMLVARKGDGALRDALSAFDQAVSLCGTDLRYAELAPAMGVVDVDLYFATTEHIAARSGAGMLRLVDQIVGAGYDLQEYLQGLAEHIRNLLVARTLPDADLIEATQVMRTRYLDHSAAFSESDLLRTLMVIDGADEALRASSQPRLTLELNLLKLASLQRSADLDGILAKLERLEALAQEGTLEVRPAPGSPSPPPREAQPSPEAREAPASYASAPPAKPTSGPPPPAPAPTIHPIRPALGTSPPALSVGPDPDEGEPDPPVRETAPPRASADEDEQPDPGAPSPPLPSLFGPPALSAVPTVPPKPASPPEPPPPNTPENRASFEGSAALATSTVPAAIAQAWPPYVRAIKSERIHVGSLLQHGTPVAFEEAALTIAVPDDFHQRLLGSQADFLMEHLPAHVPERVRQIRFTVAPEEARPSGATEPADEVDPQALLQRKRQENPVVRALFDRFGGELVW